MSEPTQDVPTLDGRLAGIDRRLREIQAELVPERAEDDVPAPEPPAERGRTGPLASALSRAPRGSGDAERHLDRISELTSVYADLLISLRDLLESHQPAERTAPAGELVAVSTGPFASVDAVRAFERRLAALPEVIDVHLRGYEGDDRAVFDVRIVGDSS